MPINNLSRRIISCGLSLLILTLGLFMTSSKPKIIIGNIHDTMMPRIASEVYHQGYELHKDIISAFGYFYFLLHGLTSQVLGSVSADFFQNHVATSNFIFALIFLVIFSLFWLFKLIDRKQALWLLPFYLATIFCVINIGGFDYQRITWYAPYNYHSWALYFLLMSSVSYLLRNNLKSQSTICALSLLAGVISAFLFYYKINFAFGVGFIFAFYFLNLKDKKKWLLSGILFFLPLIVISLILTCLHYDIFAYIHNISEISSVRSEKLYVRKLPKFFILITVIYLFLQRNKIKLTPITQDKVIDFIATGFLLLGFIMCFVGDYNQPVIFIFLLFYLLIDSKRPLGQMLVAESHQEKVMGLLKWGTIVGALVSTMALARVVEYQYKTEYGHDKKLAKVNSLKSKNQTSSEAYIIKDYKFGYYDLMKLKIEEKLSVIAPEILGASSKLFWLDEYVESLNESTRIIGDIQSKLNFKPKAYVLEFTNHSVVLNDVLMPIGAQHWVHPGTTVSINNLESTWGAFTNSDIIAAPLIGTDNWTNNFGCSFLKYNKKYQNFYLVESGVFWLFFVSNKYKDLVPESTNTDIFDSFTEYCKKDEA